MRAKASEISSLCIRQAKDLFGDLLAIVLPSKVPGSRNRTFPLPVVFWMFLCQTLATGSCRHAVSSARPLFSRKGKGGRVERWRKPNTRPKWIGACDYAETPDCLTVCTVTVVVDPGAGFRTTEINLASTVTDPEEVSATQIGSLYLDRWKVELFIDDLKTTLGMAVPSSRSPAMIRWELLVHIIAYNLRRALMTRGKTAAYENPSFKGAIDRLNHWLPVVPPQPLRNPAGGRSPP